MNISDSKGSHWSLQIYIAMSNASILRTHCRIRFKNIFFCLGELGGTSSYLPKKASSILSSCKVWNILMFAQDWNALTFLAFVQWLRADGMFINKKMLSRMSRRKSLSCREKQFRALEKFPAFTNPIYSSNIFGWMSVHMFSQKARTRVLGGRRVDSSFWMGTRMIRIFSR
jgi:hypothetical protein